MGLKTKFCCCGKLVPIPIFAVCRREGEAQKVFHSLHVKAWRKNGYPPVASQFDVPPVVACVLRSFHGHRLAPEEEGYNDHSAVSRVPALQGILNVQKDKDERMRKALQKAAKQKGQATDPMEGNKVRVDRAKPHKAKAPCLQPLTCVGNEALGHCQCYYLVQETVVICLSFNGLMHCTFGGTEGGRPGGLEGVGEGVYGLCHP